MMDDRSPRIHLTLTIWTLLLIGSVLVEARRLPPGLTVLLLPYLVLMAWHWMSRLRRRGSGEPAISRDGAAGSPSDDESDECADSPGSDDCPGSINLPSRHCRPASGAGFAPSSRRGRARRRPKAHEPEPSAASWVQVRPGRFVRVEEISPEHSPTHPTAIAGLTSLMIQRRSMSRGRPRRPSRFLRTTTPMSPNPRSRSRSRSPARITPGPPTSRAAELEVPLVPC